MAKYRKLLVAGIGLLAVILSDVLKINLPFTSDQLTDWIIMFLTAIGVWAAPNET